MARLCTIYALSDPRLERVFENVRYVGKTQQQLPQRLTRHIADKYNCYRRNWIQQLLSEGISPCIWPLSFCCEDNWQAIEKRWIAQLKPIARLTNLTEGGDGQAGRLWSEEQKARHSILKKQRPMSREMLAKVCEANSAANKGRPKGPMPQATKDKLSKWRTGIKLSPEHVAKVSAANLGKKRSPESLVIIRAARAKSRIPVMCLNSGAVFESITDAARKAGVSAWGIEHSILTGKSSSGMKWIKSEQTQCPALL